MKMKQVCQLTGLTERTIRFYVEKELCAPETRWMDQRKYYDFSKENVEELRQTAELRKAYFSIQAIQTMRQQPGADSRDSQNLPPGSGGGRGS